MSMSIDRDLTPVQAVDDDGRVLRGVSGTLRMTGGALTIQKPVLSNTLIARYFMHTGEVPDGIDVQTQTYGGGRGVSYARERLDGEASEGGGLVIRFHGLTGEEPPTPLTEDQLLLSTAGDDPLARRVLEYLSYEEKPLAGSWRFTTYFGRDTLMSMAMLMPVLTDEAARACIDSVLERLNAITSLRCAKAKPPASGATAKMVLGAVGTRTT